MSLSRCNEAASLQFFAILGGLGTWVLVRVMKKSVYAAFTCIFAPGGAMVGTIAGAMKGQTTETGFLRGIGIGAVAGAITALQLLEPVADGESLSKIALLTSLVNGKVFVEWIKTMETIYREISDAYDVNGERGLSKDFIEKLPECRLRSEKIKQPCNEPGCSICLQNFQEGDSARQLPNCGHCFHLECIDKWLTRNGSCPVCRDSVCKKTDML